jgi:hypothetical protein
LIVEVHGEDLVLAGTGTASRALESLLQPGIPAAKAGYVLAFSHKEVTAYI